MKVAFRLLNQDFKTQSQVQWQMKREVILVKT